MLPMHGDHHHGNEEDDQRVFDHALSRLTIVVHSDASVPLANRP
jgi:hypothetical protein